MKRGGDDPVFRTDCLFTFDVTADANVQTYVFGVGAIYFPVPIIPRDYLVAADWTAVISVNAQ